MIPARREKTRYDLTCFCRSKPLLAVWGRDSAGRLYVHIKVWKANKLYAEVYSLHSLQITCRNCFRKHNVIIRDENMELREVSDAKAITSNSEDS